MTQGHRTRSKSSLPWERLRHLDWTRFLLVALVSILTVASFFQARINNETEVDPILKDFARNK